MSPGPDRLVIYSSKIKTVALLAAALGFVVAGLVMVCFQREEGTSTWEVIPMCAGVLFFGLGAVYLFYQLVTRRPALIIDSEGITDNTSLTAVGLIRWDEIEGIVPYRYSGQAVLGIILTDVSVLLSRLGWLQRLVVRINLKVGGAPINIPQVALPMTVQELAALVASRFPGKPVG